MGITRIQFVRMALCVIPPVSLAISGDVLSAPSSTSFTLEAHVAASAGGTSGSSGFQSHHVVGQATSVGVLSSASFSNYSGFIMPHDGDGDGFFDISDNCISDANPVQIDTDADSQGDVCDLDDDNDGLSDIVEALLSTDPLLLDTDADGLDDFTEVNMDGDASDYQAGVDTDPNESDTDGDGVLDGFDAEPLLAGFSGDVVQDGQLNAADIMRAVRIVLELDTATSEEIHLGDVYPVGTPDGVIDISDLLIIQQLVRDTP